jgi:tryprostatin B 6-hydroxylase
MITDSPIKGPYGCIGKQLALMELRTVITLLVLNFNVSFAPGEDGTKLFRDTKDMFTLDLGELKLVFEKIVKV